MLPRPAILGRAHTMGAGPPARRLSKTPLQPKESLRLSFASSFRYGRHRLGLFWVRLAGPLAACRLPSDPSVPLRHIGGFPSVSPLRFRRSISSNHPINLA